MSLTFSLLPGAPKPRGGYAVKRRAELSEPAVWSAERSRTPDTQGTGAEGTAGETVHWAAALGGGKVFG